MTRKTVQKTRARRKDVPVDSEIRAAGERINYVPTTPKQPDPELHRGLLALTGQVSELMAQIELWGDKSVQHHDVAEVFEGLARLNLSIWRLRWDGSGLSDHVVAS